MNDIRLGSRTLQPRRQLLAGGRREPIGKRALDIISVLAEAGGGIVTKDELLDAVWPGVTVEENALQVHIVALRKALGPEADRLKTIRGVGYQLDVDGRASGDATAARSETPGEQPALAADSASASSRLGAAWTKVRSYRLALALIGLVALVWGVWALFGSDLGLRSHDRIPVVVRSLAASDAGDPAEVALANGITDELIDRLRRIPELRVATVGTRGEVQEARFKDAYLVDGSLRRSGDALRVMMRLSDANGEILWSQTFNRRLVDLLDMQQRTAVAIADALSVSLDVGEDSTAYGGTDNPEAYAALLEADANGRNPDQTVPLRFIDRALEIDPDYIQALVAKSIYYDTQVNIRSGLTRQRALALLAIADESSARALALNPDLWRGHYARGWYYFTRKDFPSAVRSLQRVAELDRGDDPQRLLALASYHGFVGRTTKSLALLDSVELTDPGRRYDGGRVSGLMLRGRYREAIELAKQTAIDDPLSRQRLADRVFWSYLELGQEAEAVRYSEQYFPALAAGLRSFRADKALLTMSPAELRRWADRRYGEGGQIPVSGDAVFAAYDGHPQLAVQLLRVAFERPGALAIVQLWHPAMAEARKSDAFEKLVTDLGLVQVWRESGDWGDYCRPVSATEISCH